MGLCLLIIFSNGHLALIDCSFFYISGQTPNNPEWYNPGGVLCCVVFLVLQCFCSFMFSFMLCVLGISFVVCILCLCPTDGHHETSVVIDNQEFWFVTQPQLSYEEAGIYCSSNHSKLATPLTINAARHLQEQLNKVPLLTFNSCCLF